MYERSKVNFGSPLDENFCEGELLIFLLDFRRYFLLKHSLDTLYTSINEMYLQRHWYTRVRNRCSTPPRTARISRGLVKISMNKWTKILTLEITIFGLKMMVKSGLEKKIFWNSMSPFRDTC